MILIDFRYLDKKLKRRVSVCSLIISVIIASNNGSKGQV